MSTNLWEDDEALDAETVAAEASSEDVFEDGSTTGRPRTVAMPLVRQWPAGVPRPAEVAAQGPRQYAPVPMPVTPAGVMQQVQGAGAESGTAKRLLLAAAGAAAGAGLAYLGDLGTGGLLALGAAGAFLGGKGGRGSASEPQPATPTGVAPAGEASAEAGDEAEYVDDGGWGGGGGGGGGGGYSYTLPVAETPATATATATGAAATGGSAATFAPGSLFGKNLRTMPGSSRTIKPFGRKAGSAKGSVLRSRDTVAGPSFRATVSAASRRKAAGGARLPMARSVASLVAKTGTLPMPGPVLGYKPGLRGVLPESISAANIIGGLTGTVAGRVLGFGWLGSAIFALVGAHVGGAVQRDMSSRQS